MIGESLDTQSTIIIKLIPYGKLQMSRSSVSSKNEYTYLFDVPKDTKMMDAHKF